MIDLREAVYEEYIDDIVVEIFDKYKWGLRRLGVNFCQELLETIVYCPQNKDYLKQHQDILDSPKTFVWKAAKKHLFDNSKNLGEGTLKLVNWLLKANSFIKFRQEASRKYPDDFASQTGNLSSNANKTL